MDPVHLDIPRSTSSVHVSVCTYINLGVASVGHLMPRRKGKPRVAGFLLSSNVFILLCFILIFWHQHVVIFYASLFFLFLHS